MSALKSFYKALRSGGASAGKAPPSTAVDENASPTLSPPMRLLAFTPAGLQAESRHRHGKASVADSATPRTLQYGGISRDRQARESSLARTASQKIQAHIPSRASATPQQTPRTSRLGPGAQDSSGAGGAGTAMAAAGAPTQPLPDSSDNIKVIVRVRPRNDREGGLGGVVCVQPVTRSTLHVTSHPEPHDFTFDHVADERTSQESMFRVCGKPIVENCLQGYNSCIFAYGQTGSGKTYTMLGADATACDSHDENRGLIQRVFEHLFARIQEQQAASTDAKYNLRCCFLEIYNETITDLLNPQAVNLAVREDLRQGVYVEGLREVEVTCLEDVIALLQTGATNRRVAETDMNEKSSRSHSVFTATLESKMIDDHGASHLRFSRLHLVDLAGSERQKSSGAAGERLKEASSINKSLSTLGLVIMSLVARQHGRARHIPYRDSRLTFLLQDSLGGNAKTCLVATISPAAVNMAETLSTLRFADNAKRIKNKAVVNEDVGDPAALRREIKRLREELAAAQRMSAGKGAGAAAHVESGADGCSTPVRIQAAAEALTGSRATLTQGPAASHATRKALVGALRREDAAVKQVRRLEGQIEGLKELVQALQQDVQRNSMVMKLKESRLARLQGAAQGTVAEDSQVATLQQELQLLKAKLEAHPEVKRFAMENLQLQQELERLSALVDRNELKALQADVDVMRGEMLQLAESTEQAHEEAAVHRAMAESARAEADLAAEQVRVKADMQARAASELAQLRAQVAEQQRQVREQGTALAAASRESEERAARVAMLQEEVDSLEAARAVMRAEMSPVKRQAQGYEHELGLLRQQSQAADVRASTEHTLRSQAELTLSQLQMRIATVEAECEQLRRTNQELFRAKSDAEKERDNAAGMEALCQSLRQQLDLERSAAVDRDANHADTCQEVEAARKHVAALRADVERLTVERLEAEQMLGRAKDDHEAELSGAAERLKAALAASSELQTALEARMAEVEELQQEKERMLAQADELTQRCTELHAEKLELAARLEQQGLELAARDHDVVDLETRLDTARSAHTTLAAEERERLQAQLVAAASEQERKLRGQLAETTAALTDASDQLAEVQDRLGTVEAHQAELEFELSDKSASLLETSERLSAAKASLTQWQARAALAEARLAGTLAAGGDSEAPTQTEPAAPVATPEALAEENQPVAPLQQRLEEAEAALQEAQSRCANLMGEVVAAEEQVQDLRRLLEQEQVQRARVEAALSSAKTSSDSSEGKDSSLQRVAELSEQLARLQRDGMEREEALLLRTAELREARSQLAEGRELVERLSTQLQTKEQDVAQVRAEMAAEVSEAAQQVQRQLEAQATVQALRQQAALAEGQMEALTNEVEMLRAELAGAAEEITSALPHGAGRELVADLERLVEERESWIEELSRERAAASSAMDSVRALELRLDERKAERTALQEALEETHARHGRATKLEDEVAHLSGHQNIQQRIKVLEKIKEENSQLREELGKLRIESHRAQVRLDRATAELARLREPTGQGMPDFDAEERLKEELGRLKAENEQLGRQYAALARAVTALAAGPALSGQQQDGSATAEAGSGRPDGAVSDDIVLEFASPTASSAAKARRLESAASSAEDGDSAAALEAGAQRALEQIRHAQLRSARDMADSQQQIRLLRERNKLDRLRRASGVAG